MADLSKNSIVPEHIAIIMDGNRRWARERNLPDLEGHLKGYNIAKNAPEWFFKKGVKAITLWAFSCDNWKRDKQEVNFLMGLLKRAIEEESEEAIKKGYRVLISGRLSELPGSLPDDCQDLMDKTKDGQNGTINLCVNYGGRLEIIDAIGRIIKDKIEPKDITENTISKYLYHHDIGEPDMIARTSGEQRLSGFLLWQSAYSELMFLKKYWPDFEKQDVDMILKEFEKRNRRFGGN